jgi:hypothetical protein
MTARLCQGFAPQPCISPTRIFEAEEAYLVVQYILSSPIIGTELFCAFTQLIVKTESNLLMSLYEFHDVVSARNMHLSSTKNASRKFAASHEA